MSVGGENAVILTNILLAAFTFLLVVVGGLQVWLLFGTLRATRKAADAAKMSADALVDSDRAWLTFGEVKILDLEPMPVGGTPKIPGVQYGLQNSGKTPAWLLRWKAQFKKLNSEEELPVDPQYGEAREFPNGVPIGPGGFRPESIALEGALSEQEFTRVKRRELFLIFYAFAEYRDVFKRTHRTRLCLVWNEPSGFDHYRGFRYGGPSNYNEQG